MQNVTYIQSGAIAQLVERWNDDLEIAGSYPLYMYFSSNNVRLLAYVFTVGDPRLEWLKRYESNRVYCFQTIFLSLVYL